MKRILLFFVLFSFTAYSQQDVFSRSEVSTGNWWDGSSPWYYATWNNSQQRPDLTLPTRNYVKIGHNNNLTMTTNGAFFTLASLDFQSGASSVRTINSGGGGTGISLTLGIYNASSATHVINTEIGVDDSTVQFQANSTGGLSFGNTIYINSNTAEFGGGSNIAVSGKLTGSGGKLTKVGAGTLTLSNAANDYSGVTNVDAGTLVVQKAGHSASITTGAIAFTFASTTQAAGTYDFLPGQLGGSTSRTLTSNLVAGKTVTFNYTTGDVTICDLSTAPTGVLGTTTICSGTGTSLTVDGGSKGTAAVTQWFTGSCGGTLVGTGDVLNTGNLIADTTYFVRYSGTCNNTTCAQVTVTVTPLTTNGSVTTSICDGETYVWPANGQSYTTAQTNVTHVVGCNTATLNLTITPVRSWYLDADTDGYYVGTAIVQCQSPGAGYTTTVIDEGDCDDADDNVNPDASEVNFNGKDDDCDGFIFNGHDAVVSNVSPPSGALALMTTPITCSVATNTTPYSGASVVHKFRVTRTSPPAAPVEFESASRTFSISQLAIAAYSATYEVQATAIVNGEEQPYNGNTATVTTPSAPVISTVSQISTNQCNQTLTAINSYIYASNGPASTQLYDFEVIREVEGLPTHTQVYTTTAPYFRLTSLAMPATYGTIYKVRSRYGYNSFGSEIRSAYSTQCTITTPSMPTVQVVGTQCGQTLASINAYVYSTAGLGSANLYEFKVTRIVAPGETAPAVIEETIPRIVPYFRLTMLENLFIGLGKEYSVSVRYRVNTPGVTPSIQFSDWSPVVCSVFTPEFPTTGVVDAQCNLIDFTPSMTQYIYAGTVTGATQYRFRLELFDELSETPEIPVYSDSVDSANNYVTLNQFTGLSSSTTYVITVSVELNGEFGPFGKDCAVTTPTIAARTTATMVNSGFEATAYPNPFANNFTLGVKTSSQSSIGVKVFDMVGRLVDQSTVNVSELKNATIGDQYPSGVYNVVITQDGVVKTLRVVKR